MRLASIPVAGLLAVGFLLFSAPSPDLACATTWPVEFFIRAESAFPDGIRFTLEYSDIEPVDDVRVFYRVAGEQVTRYAPFEFTADRHTAGTEQTFGGPVSYYIVDTSLLVRTDTADRYIPPGAEIEWWGEATLSGSGMTRETEVQRFVFLDPRFEWSRLDAPGVYLHYHGGREGRARRALEAARETLERMGALMGIEETDTLRLTVYNGIEDMRRALPPRSEVQETVLVTEGVSFGDTGVVLLLGGNPEVEGVAAHETVHFLMRFAVGRSAGLVPAWLNEGLAEYANPFPSPSFQNVFSRRLYDNTLLPLTSLTSPPGRPEDNLLMYGQSESVVTYMVETYGEEPLQALLARLGEGLTIDEALTAAYGFDRTGLEQEWRTSIGAPPLAATPSRSALPTPIPRPTLVPFGVGGTPLPEATRPRPSPPQAPAPTGPAQEQSSGGCNRAKGGGVEGAIVVSLAMLGVLALRRRR